MENFTESCVEINFHEMQCRQSFILSDTIIDLEGRVCSFARCGNSNLLTYERRGENKSFGEITPAISIPDE